MTLTASVGRGLSPRVRGNPLGVLRRQGRRGSIPARAGEPSWVSRPAAAAPVYPRACGGTSARQSRCHLAYGLSPRVRGNRGNPRQDPELERSIPARAGEPRCRPCRCPAARVYPRACGGTKAWHTVWVQHNGLSPRVRGNLLHAERILPAGGSIPARAGEPVLRVVGGNAVRVYPRACGGTDGDYRLVWFETGLSPRVRGNLPNPPRISVTRRSIPARAGEPSPGLSVHLLYWVYPRACGGTYSSAASQSPS